MKKWIMVLMLMVFGMTFARELDEESYERNEFTKISYTERGSEAEGKLYKLLMTQDITNKLGYTLEEETATRAVFSYKGVLYVTMDIDKDSTVIVTTLNETLEEIVSRDKEFKRIWEKHKKSR